MPPKKFTRKTRWLLHGAAAHDLYHAGQIKLAATPALRDFVPSTHRATPYRWRREWHRGTIRPRRAHPPVASSTESRAPQSAPSPIIGGVTEFDDKRNDPPTDRPHRQPEHLVFVLLDGLGAEHRPQTPPESFIKRHLAMEMLTISPSTTACALTSVATADYPGRHGVAGWFTHLPDHNSR
jgi:hypothetical protein